MVTTRNAASVAAVALLAAACSSPSKPHIAATTTSIAPTTASGPCEGTTSPDQLFITPTCDDPLLNRPYTDRDEQRTTTDPATHVTVSYRYIHGGFTGTNAKFSLYFPSARQYRDRFFQSTYPTLTQEDTTLDTIAFAISNGAYAVSTNNAGGVQVNAQLGAYRVNAAAAKYSRDVARRVYRRATTPRGYLYGASGGAYQTVGAMESTTGVWQGGVPAVFGVPNAIPSFMTVQLLALRVLHDKLPAIASAMEPGGSGDPYAGLDGPQRAVLQEVTRVGFPLRGWWQYATLNGGGFSATEGGVRAFDSSYVDDFWNKPGYEGSDPTVRAARIQQDATVVAVATNTVTLSNVPSGDLVGADLTITSGAAAGKALPIGAVGSNVIDVADEADTTAIRPGDRVRLDNSWLVALEYYQRHQVPDASQYAWNQFRNSAGSPTEPQRPVLVGPIFTKLAGGTVPTGRFNGKMIMLGSVMDVQAFPWSEDWYRKQVAAAVDGRVDDSFRLWYMDNADHDPAGAAAASQLVGDQVSAAAFAADHIVSYTGELQQALLDLDAWVERGTAPPASTKYTVDADNQIHLVGDADQRAGVQPVVSLSVAKAGGATRGDVVDITVQDTATFRVSADARRHTGKIVKIEWDLEGAGNYTDSRSFSPAAAVSRTVTHTFTRPGTYFVVVRVTSQRDGNPGPWALIQNLARARIVVH